MDGQIDPRLLIAVKVATGIATPSDIERYRDEQAAPTE